VKILHTVAGLFEHTGGPATSVPALCRELARLGHQVTLFTGEGPLAPAVRALADTVCLRTVPLGPYRLANYSVQFARACNAEAQRADLVHTHGLWLYPNWASARAAQRYGKPLVVSPRGMLASWSLGRRRLVKALLWRLVDGRCVRSAAVVHATSDAEAADLRQRGLGRVVVIPNGVDTQAFTPVPGRTGEGGAGRRVLFLGRIHPVKGLDPLLQAWARVAARHPLACLELAGHGEARHVAWLESHVAKLRDLRITYLGPASNEQRLLLLQSATVVVLPSFTENYGMVVAEALACGKPVIASTGTPWRALAEHGCGWWVPAERDALAAALDEALSAPAEKLAAMGREGRQFVVAEHSIASAAARMVAVYEWLLARAPRPEWVEV
jgi:glycosyltransferase involved in cell wall biosynthesis